MLGLIWKGMRRGGGPCWKAKVALGCRNDKY